MLLVRHVSGGLHCKHSENMMMVYDLAFILRCRVLARRRQLDNDQYLLFANVTSDLTRNLMLVGKVGSVI